MLLRLRGEQVSERSLELNVMGEAVNHVRRAYGRAYLVGYTTRQEADHGIDVSIEAPGKIVAAFQFKAPKKKRDGSYVFRICERCWVCGNPNIKRPRYFVANVLNVLGVQPSCINQHILLCMTALALKHSTNLDVYYALPLVSTYSELEQRVPNLLQYTILIPVLSLPTKTLLDCKSHTISISMLGGNPNNVTITINSKPVKLPKESYTTLEELLKKKLEKEKELPDARQVIHIPTDELKKLLRKVLLSEGTENHEDQEKLVEALTKISFSYRGTALVAKKTNEEILQK